MSKTTETATKKPATKKPAAPKPAAPKTTAAKATKPAAARKPAAKKTAPAAGPQLVPALTHEQIAKRAYELWASRGYAHGNPAHDWWQAEQELKRA